MKPRLGPHLPILLYHHIGSPTPHTERERLTICPSTFEKHLRWLKNRGYRSITAAQWLAWYHKDGAIPEKPILITFDDGYADISKYALPLLEKYGFVASIFIITSYSKNRTRWEDSPVMTMEEIQSWASRGMEIGSHSRTHPNLVRAGPSIVYTEIEGSREDLVEAGLSPVSFSYPFGSYDDHIKSVVAKSFKIAFSIDQGLNDLRTDLLSMRRTTVQPSDTLFDIFLRSRFGWSPISEVILFYKRWQSRVRGCLKRVPQS